MIFTEISLYLINWHAPEIQIFQKMWVLILDLSRNEMLLIEFLYMVVVPSYNLKKWCQFQGTGEEFQVQLIHLKQLWQPQSLHHYVRHRRVYWLNRNLIILHRELFESKFQRSQLFQLSIFRMKKNWSVNPPPKDHTSLFTWRTFFKILSLKKRVSNLNIDVSNFQEPSIFKNERWHLSEQNRGEVLFTHLIGPTLDTEKI